METLRLKNYRCFEDTGDIRIKPITVLIGANSSGKSSFLKYFPLLKQSEGIKKEGVFLWYSEDVDFKDFKNTVKDGKGDIVVDMGIKFNDHVLSGDKSFAKYLEESHSVYTGELVHVELTISKHKTNSDYLECLRFSYLNQECSIHFTNKKVKSIIINGEEMPIGEDCHFITTSHLIPHIDFRFEHAQKAQSMHRNPIMQTVLSEMHSYDESINDTAVEHIYDRAFYLLKKEDFNSYLAKELKIEARDNKLNNLPVGGIKVAHV